METYSSNQSIQRPRRACPHIKYLDSAYYAQSTTYTRNVYLVLGATFAQVLKSLALETIKIVFKARWHQVLWMDE
jgi:hypothetical protein